MNMLELFIPKNRRIAKIIATALETREKLMGEWSSHALPDPALFDTKHKYGECVQYLYALHHVFDSIANSKTARAHEMQICNTLASFRNGHPQINADFIKKNYVDVITRVRDNILSDFYVAMQAGGRNLTPKNFFRGMPFEQMKDKRDNAQRIANGILANIDTFFKEFHQFDTTD